MSLVPTPTRTRHLRRGRGHLLLFDLEDGWQPRHAAPGGREVRIDLGPNNMLLRLCLRTTRHNDDVHRSMHHLCGVVV
jgi:hypothetical protein